MDNYCCSFCNRYFKSRISLSLHLRQIHKMSKMDIGQYYNKVEYDKHPEQFVLCCICGNIYKTLNQHLPTFHNITVEEYKVKYDAPINSIYLSLSLSNKRKCFWNKLTEDERSEIGSKSRDSRIANGTNNLGGRPKGIPMSEEQKEYFSNLYSGEGNPFYKHEHSQETKQLMSDNHADFNGDKNPYRRALEKDESKREAASARSKETWRRIKEDPERYREVTERLSESTSKAILEGRLDVKSGNKKYKQGYFYSPKFGELSYYRSSFELRFLEWCEEDESIWDLKSCPFRIPYREDGKNKNYIPDFLVNNRTLVEIKPLSLLEIGSPKHIFAAEYCEDNEYNFLFLTEIELEYLELGAIKF